MRFDPIASDPVPDTVFPTTQAGVVFESKGKLINGILLIAQGSGPHPTIMFLHGFPGHERNFDLAQIFRRAGWNVLIFHYRGSWGSQGSYSFENCIEDVSSALGYLRAEKTCELYRVDPQNIVVIGHSMGGFYAWVAAAVHDSMIRSVGFIAGMNLGGFFKNNRENQRVLDVWYELFEDSLPPLQGTTADKLLQEALTNADRWSLLDYVDSLSPRSLLLIGASHDEVLPVPVHHEPLVDALINKNAPNLTSIVLDSDHTFTDKRIALARNTLKWLDKQR